MGIIGSFIYGRAVKASARQAVAAFTAEHGYLGDLSVMSLMMQQPWPGLGPQAENDFRRAILLEFKARGLDSAIAAAYCDKALAELA
jgi:hypothetical protein